MVKRIGILVAVIIGVGLMAFGVARVKVGRVTCQSQLGECGEEVRKSLGKIVGQPLFVAKNTSIETLRVSPYVNDYSVSFKLPRTLFITVLERQAVWALVTQGYSAHALIDANGRVISYRESAGLPSITIDKPLSGVGEVISKEYLNGLTLFAKTAMVNEVKKAVITGDSLSLELATGQTVIYSLSEESDVQAGALVLLLARLNSVSAEFTIDNVKTIDLRFANPVLK